MDNILECSKIHIQRMIINFKHLIKHENDFMTFTKLSDLLF